MAHNSNVLWRPRAIVQFETAVLLGRSMNTFQVTFVDDGSDGEGDDDEEPEEVRRCCLALVLPPAEVGPWGHAQVCVV